MQRRVQVLTAEGRSAPGSRSSPVLHLRAAALWCVAAAGWTCGSGAAWGQGAAVLPLAPPSVTNSTSSLVGASVPAFPLPTPTPPPAVISEPLQPGAFFFRDGDRAQILGDSITEQRMYSTLIESYVLSRFPSWQIQFRNTGWSGDGMPLWCHNGLEIGFTRDIAPLHPTAITIDFGMNDARAGDTNLPTYNAAGVALAQRLFVVGARTAFLSPSPEERYQPGQPAGSDYNLELRKYAAAARAVAVATGNTFVNQTDPLINLIEAGRRAGVLSSQEGGTRLIPDGVHPNWGGHLAMAATILEGLNAPAEVSSVTIDDASGAATAQNAAVSQVQTGATVSFVRLDNALPWPLPQEETVGTVLRIPGFTPLDQLSRYGLTVTNLPLARYTVRVGGQFVGTYTHDALAAGVNFTLEAGPVTDQTHALLAAILAKNQIFFERWRHVQLFAAPAWIDPAAVEAGRSAEEARLDLDLAEAERKCDVLRQPVAHTWTLTPVTGAQPYVPRSPLTGAYAGAVAVAGGS